MNRIYVCLGTLVVHYGMGNACLRIFKTFIFLDWISLARKGLYTYVIILHILK